MAQPIAQYSAVYLVSENHSISTGIQVFCQEFRLGSRANSYETAR